MRGFAMNVGYARVSTREQNLSGQVAELTAAGCVKVFREKASGDRVELMKVLRRLEPGDVLMVTRLDRLARSTRDLLNVLAAVTECRRAPRSHAHEPLSYAACDGVTIQLSN
jgi:DNA invertase Pin-like site-specific DNA recombinase